MANIHPFKGFRPKADIAHQVASRPYDVLNRAEAKAEAAGNPYSYLHVVRSEISLPDEVSAYSEAVYEKAKANFEQMTQDKVLLQVMEFFSALIIGSYVTNTTLLIIISSITLPHVFVMDHFYKLLFRNNFYQQKEKG